MRSQAKDSSSGMGSPLSGFFNAPRIGARPAFIKEKLKMAAKQQDTSLDNPGDYADLPVRPAGGGYGATAEDIARGYRPIEQDRTDGRTAPIPEHFPTIPAKRE
jgi:hypothetical protein